MESYNWFFIAMAFGQEQRQATKENFETRSCSGPTYLRKIEANTLIKFVLTDHHILILKVLKTFSHIK